MQHLHFMSGFRSLRILWAIILTALLLTQQIQPVNAATGVPVLRTFEDLPIGQPVFNQYDGVTFLTGDSDSHPITIFQPTVATASPTHALQDVIVSGCELTCAIQMTMQFDNPQDRVSLSTGLAISLGVPLTMLLQGFASDPRVSGAPLVAQSAASCLGSGPTPIITPLKINDSATRIRYAVLSVVTCSDPTNPFTFGNGNGTIVLDNLLYNRPLHPPAREHNPPLITITSPTNGSVVQGTTPDTIDTNVLATVKEQSGLMSMTAQVNGHTAVPMHYWNTGPGSLDAGITLFESSGLIEGMNTVVVTAVDFDRPPNTSTASVTFTFKKLAPPPPNKVDIIPTAFEVTQTIDPGPLNDWDPTVNGYVARVVPDPSDPQLIQGKPTLIRIYAAASGTNSPIKNVPATFFVVRDHCTSGCGISGADGILAPMSGWTAPYPKGVPIPNITGITVPPFGTPDSIPSNAAPDLRKTWDFLLPADWAQSDLVVTIDINSGNYSNLPHGTPVPECTSNTAGTCNHNNEVELHLHFIPKQQITVNPVYIHVSGSYKGVSYNDVQPTTTQVDSIFQLLNTLYPVQVIQGQRYDRTVGPDISGDDLLDFVKNNFGTSTNNEFFMGIFPGNQGAFAANDGGTVGEAPRNGGQVAWSNANLPFAAAHELAHDIGFDHWACGHDPGFDDDECKVFPILHGGIGGFGTDIPNWRVISPGDTNNPINTSHAHDFMTAVIQPIQWISWYTYNILLDHHTVSSFDTDDPPALLVRGRITPGGVATLRPIYQVDVTSPITDTITEDDPNNIYTIQGIDTKGNVLFVHNFEPFMYDTHQTGPSGLMLGFEEAVPVVPDLQRIEVLRGSTVLGTLMNPAPGAGPSVTISDPTSASVWQVGKRQTIHWSSSSPTGVPLVTMVQYSPDGGKTRILLGRDLSGTSLTINPDELPGSKNAMIYVQVSDGMNTATASAGPFIVQPKAPSVHIITPSRNSQVTAHVPLTLEGTAYDRQESLTDAQFQWSSDRDGVLGIGQQLTVSKLSIGHHTLTLTVTDSQGRIERDQVQIDVVAFGASQPPPSFNWLIFWAIAIGLLLLVLVVAVIIILRRRQTGGPSVGTSA